MHWLYFDELSPTTLEKAGADFDSSIGYNQTVGYRSGTTQVYKPLSATRLLELPLHVMDTALFYPTYLGLSLAEAGEQIQRIIDNAAQVGGVVTVNWHDRSLSPERLWSGSYLDLLKELKAQRAWFATATQVVTWFRKRRKAVFANTRDESEQNHPLTVSDEGHCLPGLLLRIHDGTHLHHDISVGQIEPGSYPDLDSDHAGVKCIASYNSSK
jgi:hypothetical protein